MPGGARDEPGHAGEEGADHPRVRHQAGSGGRYDPIVGVITRIAKALDVSVGRLLQ
jgi:hypothetical protein